MPRRELERGKWERGKEREREEAFGRGAFPLGPDLPVSSLV